MLDSTRLRETPEGIDISFAPAGPVIRSAAWVIDFLIRFTIYFCGAIVLGMLGQDLGTGLILILFFAVEWLYPIIFEARSGQTPGKKQMGIRVINDDGTPPGWQECMVRNLIRFVDFLPLFYGVGLISCFLNKDFKRLGDLAAGTLVVHDPIKKNDKELVPPNIAAHPLALNLQLEEQQAMVQFAERHRLLTPSRQQELANIIAPLIPSVSVNANSAQAELLVEKLHAHAAWLSGRTQATDKAQ